MAPDISSSLEKAATQASRENLLRFILTICTRRWRLILLFTCSVAFIWGAFALWRYKDQPQYQAVAELVLQRSPYETGALKDVAARRTPASPKELIKTLAADIPEDVARALVQQDVASGQGLAGVVTDGEYRARADAIQLSFEPDQDTGIRIIARARAKDEAMRIAELAARAFIQRERALGAEGERRAHAYVQRELDLTRQRLDEAESAEWQFRRQMGFRTHEQVTREMDRMAQDILAAQAEREQILATMEGTEARLQEVNEELPRALGQITDEVINRLLSNLDDLVQKKTEMEVFAKPTYAPLQALCDEIFEKEAAVRQALQQLDAETGGGTAVWRDRQSLREQYIDLQWRLTLLDISTATKQKLLGSRESALPELMAQSKTYRALTRESEQEKTHFEKLSQIEFELRTALSQEASKLERHRSVMVSTLPGPYTSSRTWTGFLMGAALGLVLGAATAMFLEQLDSSIRGIEDAAEHLQLEVIGTIPEMKFGKTRRRHRGNYVSVTEEEQVDACIVTQHDPKSPISEAYRNLRTQFQFATFQAKPKSVMVTSSVPGEGKTTTAVNMAVTFADSGFRVLIIDTDLRRPHVHHVLKMERGTGLADILREDLDYREVVRKTRVPNLSIISSGRVPPNPSELIGSDRMRSLMRKLGGEFDLVICDAPSLLVVTDPVLLSTEVDTVAIVVAVRNARRETILRGKKLLETARADISGVVLNGLEATRRHYYYYYYYYDDSRAARHKRWLNI
jgi:capsular exopolysaccharide synthesis family protein